MRLPFTKTERIIIGIVLLLHALPALEFLHFTSRPPKLDDARVMANLVSPDTADSKSQPTAPPPNLKKSRRKRRLKKSYRKSQPLSKPKILASSRKVSRNRQAKCQMQQLHPQRLAAPVAHQFRQTLVNSSWCVSRMRMPIIHRSPNAQVNKAP